MGKAAEGEGVTEGEQERSDHLLRELFDANPDPAAFLNRDHRVVWVNRALARAFGCRREELEGRFCYEVFHKRDSPLGGCPHSLLLTDGKEHVGEVYLEALGACYWLSATPVYGKSGEVLGSLHVARDVSAYKALEAALQRATDEVAEQATARVADVASQQLRREIEHLDQVSRMAQLSAALAHELNQPLAAMHCNALAAGKLLEKSPPDLAEARAALADIVTCAKRAGEVMSRTKALFKGESLQVQPVRVRPLVEGVVKLLRQDIALAGAEVTCGVAEELPEIVGDPVQLQQVLINLIRNALEAVRQRGEGDRRVAVTAEPLGASKVRLCVEDNGPGISEEMREMVFLPFFTEKSDGMGMGLAISRQIVKRHGGTLTVGRAAGGGARLEVLLPVGGAVAAP